MALHETYRREQDDDEARSEEQLIAGDFFQGNRCAFRAKVLVQNPVPRSRRRTLKQVRIPQTADIFEKIEASIKKKLKIPYTKN